MRRAGFPTSATPASARNSLPEETGVLQTRWQAPLVTRHDHESSCSRMSCKWTTQRRQQQRRHSYNVNRNAFRGGNRRRRAFRRVRGRFDWRGGQRLLTAIGKFRPALSSTLPSPDFARDTLHAEPVIRNSQRPAAPPLCPSASFFSGTRDANVRQPFLARLQSDIGWAVAPGARRSSPLGEIQDGQAWHFSRGPATRRLPR